jgi:hypothetical protein
MVPPLDFEASTIDAARYPGLLKVLDCTADVGCVKLTTESLSGKLIQP